MKNIKQNTTRNENTVDRHIKKLIELNLNDIFIVFK